MPKPTLLGRLIRFHRWRYLHEEDIVTQIIGLAAEIDAAEIVAQLEAIRERSVVP